MPFIRSLRQLVDFQQFTQLKTNSQSHYDETGNVDVLPLLALAHLHLTEWSEAQDIILQLQPKIQSLNIDARIDMAAVFCLMGRIDEALLLLEEAQKSAADNSLLLARLAWCRVKQGQLKQARDLYQKSADYTPERLPVWYALVRLDLQEQRFELAQQELDQAITIFEAIYAELPSFVAQQFTGQFRSLQLELWANSGEYEIAEQWFEERQPDLSEDDWVELVGVYSTFLAGLSLHDNAEALLQKSQKQYPKNSFLYSQLAEISNIQGRTMQAVQRFKRAVALEKSDEKHKVQLLIRIVNTCLHSMPEKAKIAADKALSLTQEMQVSEYVSASLINQLQLQAKCAIAQVASQAQDFSEAEQLFKNILEKNRYFLPALQGLGQQEMQRGNIEQAISLFERVKAIDPTKGYTSLINARQFPKEEAILERMERAAREPSMEGQIRSGLLLQIATAREKNKDYDQAFSLALEANNAYKKRLKYDASEHRNNCSRIRYAFGKAFFEHRKNYGSSSSMPIFVLGMPRSGTTLVEQILASHSDIFGAGELGVISGRIQGIKRWERHTGSGRSYPDCVDDLNESVTRRIAASILDELTELCAEDKPDAKHVVDKLPHNFENIGFIKFLFPNAKIISVRRDPRDIAISNFFTDYQAKHGGMGFSYDLSWIGEQLADHNLMMHHWQQVFPGEILEVKYEDVVEDVAGSAKRMLDYIGVPWEPQVVAFNELDRAVKTASVWQVRQPVYKTSKAKWLRYKDNLAPLIKATNAKITPKAINDMLSLPEAGLLSKSTALYKEGDLDGAEHYAKKMLHHNPLHGACNYILALIYCRKGYVKDAVPLFEQAHQQCKWKKDWRSSLIKAYEQLGETEKANALKIKKRRKSSPTNNNDEVVEQNIIERDDVIDGSLEDDGESEEWLLEDMDDGHI